ncbi:uncharacterized protein LOC120358291 [Solenopsis invicta]|uniref:uncharacterized protein LOC120358291 n=1 Tax=Solenopsis invicta TaxID=13686 RepID=UPI00193D9184|nr:uncharacterized protein LOC120358291 [Solenopsis invicta]
MANILESGFIKAHSTNLPKIDAFMVCEFVKESDKFNAAEVRNAKAAISSRESYGDKAIGYVCLKRDESLGTCIVQCKICPEHRNKGYSVTLTVNEKEEKVIDVQCHDCAASSGGCKHAIAFLMWIHRKSENPSITEIECYWRRSSLASIGTSKKYIELKEFGKTDVVDTQRLDNSSFLKAVIHKAKEKQLDSQLSRHNFVLESRKLISLSIHQLLLNFCENGCFSIDKFLDCARKEMSEDLCRMAEELTRYQSDTQIWHELRYGRITASRIYEAAHCKTSNGTFVQQIIGVSKIFESQAMQRGKKLEKEVLIEARKITQLFRNSFKDCGLVLLPLFPILGASPDAIGDDFIVEVKCPSIPQVPREIVRPHKASDAWVRLLTLGCRLVHQRHRSRHCSLSATQPLPRLLTA